MDKTYTYNYFLNSFNTNEQEFNMQQPIGYVHPYNNKYHQKRFEKK